MPKVAYTEEEREQIRKDLIAIGLELMAKQGFQHTTVEQIYKKVGISRTFFYTFFSTKEDLILETLYFQQPKIIEYANKLMNDPNLSWRDSIKKFLYSCVHGEKYGIAVLTVEEQQLIFNRLSEESYKVFRKKQAALFGNVLECFGLKATKEIIDLFINLCLGIIVIKKAIPKSLPLFVPEAVDDTVDFQINAMVDFFEELKDLS